MEKAKKVKIFLGSAYILILVTFLWFIFSHFSISDFSSFDIIKENRNNLNKVKNNNFFLSSFLFLILCIVWTILLGFATPIILIGGFIFGNWLGTLFLIIGMSIGATGLYIFANYFLKDLIKEKFLTKFKSLEFKFKKSEFLYLLIYRFVGGIPFAISNVLPCIFNVKVSNFFWATFIGMIPQIFILTSISSGLEKVVDQNLKAPKVTDVIFNPDIYIPLITFFILILMTIFFRKFFYKK